MGQPGGEVRVRAKTELSVGAPETVSQGSSPTVPGCSTDLRKVGNDSTDLNNNLTVNLNIDHNINLIIDQNIDHTIDLTQTEEGEEDADNGTRQSWSTNCASMQFPTYLILFIAYLCKVNKCHSQRK